MPLQNFVNNAYPTVKSAWLNAIDAFYFTLFNSATTAAQARAAIGAISQTLAVAAGDTLQASGAGVFAGLTLGAAGTRYHSTGTAVEWQGNWFSAITATRAHDAASGVQAYTGAGFKPKAALFSGAINGTREATFFGVFAPGLSSGYCLYDAQVTPGVYGYNAGLCMVFDEATGTKSQIATGLTFNADGLSLTWTRLGATAANNIDFTIFFLR